MYRGCSDYVVCKWYSYCIGLFISLIIRNLKIWFSDLLYIYFYVCYRSGYFFFLIFYILGEMDFLGWFSVWVVISRLLVWETWFSFFVVRVEFFGFLLSDFCRFFACVVFVLLIVWVCCYWVCTFFFCRYIV